MIQPFVFETPLIEATIVCRKSQFTMDINLDDASYYCHCPTTGRVGNLDLSGRPCLLSRSKDPARKTAFTVEAVSLNRPDDKEKSWIGINQNAVNRYVEHYLSTGGFLDMVGKVKEIHREQLLGNSRLDFLVDSTYLEVKTPLQHLQLDIPEYVKTKKVTPFSSTDRMVKHIAELADSLQTHQRAVFLLCFVYNNPGFRVVEKSTNYEQVTTVVNNCITKGVEIWQANFKLTPAQVLLDKHFRVEL